jgi:hypothetical protein
LPLLLLFHLHFAEFCCCCIAPQIFNIVEFPCFRIKDMYNSIEIIHQNPFGIGRAFCVGWRNLKFILHFFINAIADCLDMRIGIAFANNKKVSWSIAQIAKVQLNDIFTFFIANSFYDKVIKFFEERCFYFYTPGCCQIQNE